MKIKTGEDIEPSDVEMVEHIAQAIGENKALNLVESDLELISSISDSKSEKKEVMKKTSREDFLPKIIYLSMFRHNFNTTHEETIFIHFTINGGLMEKYTLISGPPALRARRKPERRSQT